MNDVLTYVGQVSVLAACSWIVYKAVFSRDSLPRVRRSVLLVLLAGCFALPVCRITIEREVLAPTGLDRISPEGPVHSRVQPQPMVDASPPDADVAVASRNTDRDDSRRESLSVEGRALAPTASRRDAPVPPAAAGAIWLAGALAMLIWRLVGAARARRIIRRASYGFHTDDGIEVLVVGDDVPPFSYGGRIVMPLSGDAHGKAMILRHEATHIRERHGADLAAVNLATALLWFNPFVWLLRRELVLVHELAADSGVIRGGFDTKQYQYLLLSTVVGTDRLMSVASHFRTSDLRKRIVTMKRKTSRAAALKVLIVLPLIAAALAVFARTRHVAAEAGGVVADHAVQRPESADTLTSKSIAIFGMTGKNHEIAYDVAVSERKQAIHRMLGGNGGFRMDVSGRFGKKRHPVTGEEAFHRGIDIVPQNDTIRAPYSGIVRSAAIAGGYGNKLVISHEGGLETTYAHLASFLVLPGETVQGGQPIAIVGNTGLSAGKHLHLETRVNGELTEPIKTLFDINLYIHFPEDAADTGKRTFSVRTRTVTR
jgi:murein DD-endopeptidase MepM/ murein hydrolase activator NlpD